METLLFYCITLYLPVSRFKMIENMCREPSSLGRLRGDLHKRALSCMVRPLNRQVAQHVATNMRIDPNPKEAKQPVVYMY